MTHTEAVAHGSASAHTCSQERRLEILHALPFFADLDHAAMHEVNDCFVAQAADPGQLIYTAGEDAHRLFVVAVGAVKIVRHTLRGKDVLLEILGPGEPFGSMAILGDTVYADTAEAKSTGCILAINAQQFDRLLRKHGSIAVATLHIVSERLQRAYESVRMAIALSAEQRLAAELLALAARNGKQEDTMVRITLPLARQELADKIGVTIETVSRIVSVLERQGVLKAGRQWIGITDLDGLVALATERG